MSPIAEPAVRAYCLRSHAAAMLERMQAGAATPDDVAALRSSGPDPASFERAWILERGGELLDLGAGHAREQRERASEFGLTLALQLRAREASLGAYLLALACPAWGEAAPLTHGRGLDVPLLDRHPGKVLALGKNFREHAAEFGEQVPEEPLFFNKLPETLVPHGATVTVPSWYEGRFDHEAELAVVIARDGRDIPLESAMDHVAGYTVANDLTLRSLQGSDRAKKHPWFRAKNFDGACPLGPCFVPRDFLDVSDLRVTARVRHPDGTEELRQDASTKDFVTDVPHAVAWLSRHMTLHAGDILLMGTPAGVGPLIDGDVVTCAVEGIGELVTRIARPRG